MKDFFRKRIPILIFLPFLLLELVFFTSTLSDFLQKKTLLSKSPDSQLVLEVEQTRVLGATTNSRLPIFIDWAVIILIAISAFFLILLWRKISKDSLKK